MVISLMIVFLLIIAAAFFYTNPAETHKQVAIGLCELHCDNITKTNPNVNNVCLDKNVSYGYACAISNSVNQSICGVSNTIYLNNKCTIVSIQ